MKRWLKVLGVVVALSVSSAWAGGGVSPSRAAPPFSFTELSGEQVGLAQLRGQAVIVLFGTSRCAPCRENDRLLRQYQFEYQSHGLVVLSLQAQTPRRELQRYDARFPFSLLTGQDQVVARLYGVTTWPTTIFIDREGNIRAVHRGRLTEEQLLQLLPGLL
jgi:peroxiredoxin